MTWTNEQGYEEGICLCGTRANTHPDASAVLDFCADCGTVTCQDCREYIRNAPVCTDCQAARRRMTTDNNSATATAKRAAKRAANQAHEARMAMLLDQARGIVATGVCPDCGTALVRNSTLAGWWQCGAYGTESFRKPEHRGLPSCSFQTFTER